jgi:hypothetical protein
MNEKMASLYAAASLHACTDTYTCTYKCTSTYSLTHSLTQSVTQSLTPQSGIDEKMAVASDISVALLISELHAHPRLASVPSSTKCAQNENSIAHTTSTIGVTIRHALIAPLLLHLILSSVIYC